MASALTQVEGLLEAELCILIFSPVGAISENSYYPQAGRGGLSAS